MTNIANSLFYLSTTDSLLLSSAGATGVYAEIFTPIQLVQEQLTRFFAEPDYLTQLAIPFSATAGTDSWTANAEALRTSLLDGSYSIRLEIRSGAELEGAMGAYSATGTTDTPTIYLNEDWLATATTEQITAVLLEELGHSFDQILNDGADSAGDEGEIFANLVQGTEFDLTGLQQEVDSNTITLDGQEIQVENASLSFERAYQVTNVAGKESNSHDFDYNAPLSIASLSVSDGTTEKFFSGNDVSAVAINIGNERIYGWISRPIKANGVIRGFYMWTDAQFTDLASVQTDGNTDGDGDTSDNRGFILVVDQAYFDNLAFKSGSIKNVGSSSDRVDTALNSLIPTNTAPVGVNDSSTVLEDATVPLSGNVLANDTDANNDTLSVTEFKVDTNGDGIVETFTAGATATITGKGTLVINSNGAYTFTPVTNYAGTVPLVTYTVSDVTSNATSPLTSTANLSITVTAVNDAPVGTAKTVTINEDSTYTFSSADFGFTDPNDTPANSLQSVIVNLPSAGTLKLNGVALTVATEITLAQIPTLTYTPALDGNGTNYANFTFQVRDNGGTANSGVNLDGTARTFTFNVTAVNDAPVAVADTATAREQGGLNNATVGIDPGVTSGNPSNTANSTNLNLDTQIRNVLDNDTDVDTGDTKTIVSARSNQTATTNVTTAATAIAGAYGTLYLSPNGDYTYEINNSNTTVQALRQSTDTLTETFTYTMRDTAGATSSSTLTVTVQGANDTPIAANDFNAITGTPVSVVSNSASGNVLDNDTDVDANSETKTISLLPNISATLSTPFASTQTLNTVTLDYVNNIVARTGNGSNGGDAVFFVGDSVTASATPRAYILAVDSTNKTISFYSGGNNITTSDVAVAVSAGQELLIYGRSANGNIDTTAQRIATDNDYNVQLSPVPSLTLSVSSSNTSSIAIGTQLTVNNVVRTVADVDTVNNTITLDSAGGTVNISTPTNYNISQAAGSPITLVGTYGRLLLNNTGAYTYTPNAGLAAGTYQDVFNYTMQDELGATSTASLTINTEVYPTPPTANPNSQALTELATIVTVGNPAATPSPATGNVLTDGTSDIVGSGAASIAVTKLWTASNTTEQNAGTTVTGQYGTLVINADGTYTYTLKTDTTTSQTIEALNSSGSNTTLTDVFYYRIQNRDGSNNFIDGQSVSTLTITINGTNDAPVASEDTANATEAGGYNNNVPGYNPTGNVLANDTDVDNGTITVSKIIAGNTTPTVFSGTVAGTYGTLTIASTGGYTYNVSNSAANVQALYAGQTVTDTFTYEVSDTEGGTHTNTLIVTVTGANDAPVNTLPSAPTVTYNTLSPISGISVNDVDSDNNSTHLVTSELATVTLSVNHGILDLTDSNFVTNDLPTALSSNKAYISAGADGTSTLTLQGDQVAINAALATLQYKGDLYFSGTDTLTITSADGLGLQDIDNLSITVSPDARTLSVNTPTVNEGSDYAVFTVTGASEQRVTLTLTNGAATAGADYSNNLEYWNGTAWITYNGSATFPSGSTLLFVRTPILNDQVKENPETFTLTATNAAGTPSTGGTATITDDGTGTKYTGVISSNSPVENNTNLDDDRPLTISNISVNEGSLYAVFTVGGVAGQLVKLATSAGSATADTDYSTSIQYWDGSAWQNYTANSFVAIPATTTDKLFVRSAITNDGNYEDVETFALAATNTGNVTTQALATIIDDGTGKKYTGVITANSPVEDNTNLDDDRPSFSIAAASGTEGSDITFTVTRTGNSTLGNQTVTVYANLVSGNTATTDDFPANTIATVDGTTGEITPVAAIGTLTFAPGVSTQQFVVKTQADNLVEPNETFTVTITSPTGGAKLGTATATGTITNDDFRPTSSDKTITVNEDISYSFQKSDFNFSDANLVDTLSSIKITQLESAGSLKLDNIDVTLDQVIVAADISKLTFTPVGDANGIGYSDFKFTVNDGTNDSATANTITVNVTAVNDAPAGADKTITILEDGSHTFTAADFGFTDPKDSPANSLSAVIISSLPTAGTLKLDNTDVTVNQSIAVGDIGKLGHWSAKGVVYKKVRSV